VRSNISALPSPKAHSAKPTVCWRTLRDYRERTIQARRCCGRV
jgi:hypothetical protein